MSDPYVLHVADHDLPSQEAIDAIFQLALGDADAPMQQHGYFPPHLQHHGGPGMPTTGFPPFAPPPNAMMFPPGLPMPMMQPPPSQHPFAPFPPHFAPFPPHAHGMPPPMFIQPPPFQPMAPPPPLRIPNFTRMSGREIAQVVRAQLGAVRSSNEYLDDFYSERLAERHVRGNHSAAPSSPAVIPGLEMSNELRPAATLELLKALHRGQAPPAVGMQVLRPMGSLPLAPGASVAPPTPARATFSQAWAETNHTLGKLVKSNIRTPREIIEMGDVGSVGFASKTWQLRAAALEAHVLLDKIADNNALLQARAAGLHGPLPDAVTEHMRPLEQEQQRLCDKLVATLGLVNDDEKLMGLLWINRGRKAVCRAVPCLLPDGLQALLDAAARLLVFFVCTAPDGRNSSDPVQQERAALDAGTAAILSKEFSRCTLAQLQHSMELLVSTQSPESLRMVLSTPGGAEVIRSIVARGQELVDSGDAGAAKWDVAFTSFLTMAEQGIAAKES